MNSIKVEVTEILIDASILESIEKDISTAVHYLKPDCLLTWEISILICSDIEIQTINRTRRGKNKPTDVLSFPIIDLNLPIPHQIIGEIVISWDTTLHQAEKIGHSVRDEFYRLLVHGILHLFGFDHELSIQDEEIMKKKENEILNLLLGESNWD